MIVENKSEMEHSCCIFMIQKTHQQNLICTSLNKSADELISRGYKRLIERTLPDPSERFTKTERMFFSLPENKENTPSHCPKWATFQ